MCEANMWKLDNIVFQKGVHKLKLCKYIKWNVIWKDLVCRYILKPFIFFYSSFWDTKSEKLLTRSRRAFRHRGWGFSRNFFVNKVGGSLPASNITLKVVWEMIRAFYSNQVVSGWPGCKREVQKNWDRLCVN